MDEFDPHSISQDQLHELRNAAESAWGDDTRHPDYEGHPQPSAGQCYVTSRWLTKKLGGQVGVKNGHYFWVSPDRKYVIDLTGDQFSYSPEDLRYRGAKLDADDEGWTPTEDQTQYRPGPILYKLATHPLFHGFRIKTFKTENPRVKRFQERADQAYGNSTQ
jgi:hypothetical protein